MQDPSPCPSVSATAAGAGPDFIVIGAMKAASSTVSAWLEAHPQVFMVAGQDPNFFSRDEIWARGPGWYGGLFAGARPGQLCAEGSNNYTCDALYPQAAARLAATCPEARLIYLVRDPVARIVSHWVQVRADQGDAVPADLGAALAAQPERLIAPSLYWRQLNRYRAHFPDERIWIGFLEDLQSDPDAVFAGLARFLGIAGRPPGAVRNRSAGKRVPGRLYSQLRAAPGLRGLARLALPEGLRRMVRERVLSHRLTARPRLPERVLAELRATLAPDARAFLAHCGKPPGFWPMRG